jgi:hypothetical protein
MIDKAEAMSEPSESRQPIRETGTLLRDGGGFILRRDAGGTYRLELSRTPIDHVEKRVCVTGTLIAEGLVNVDGVAPI